MTTRIAEADGGKVWMEHTRLFLDCPHDYSAYQKGESGDEFMGEAYILQTGRAMVRFGWPRMDNSDMTECDTIGDAVCMLWNLATEGRE